MEVLRHGAGEVVNPGSTHSMREQVFRLSLWKSVRLLVLAVVLAPCFVACGGSASSWDSGGRSHISRELEVRAIVAVAEALVLESEHDHAGEKPAMCIVLGDVTANLDAVVGSPSARILREGGELWSRYLLAARSAELNYARPRQLLVDGFLDCKVMRIDHIGGVSFDSTRWVSLSVIRERYPDSVGIFVLRGIGRDGDRILVSVYELSNTSTWTVDVGIVIHGEEIEVECLRRRVDRWR